MIARVLIVDDDEHITRALAATLARVGFEVATATDGVQAMQHPLLFDMIVVDYHMTAAASGADVVRHFKQRHGAQIYCAVLSGEDDPATHEACTRAGADDVFTKPVAPAELRRRLTAAALALRGEAA